jgi:uncharacterized membrane protein (UPF0136 family)
MTALGQKLRRFLLPLGIFLGVATVHYVWCGLFPEVDPAQARWASLPGAGASSWLKRYLETQSYWLGYSYALSLAFVAAALRHYREERFGSAKTMALGGMTFSGFLALAGCFLAGCCGSPMLLIYLNLFGVRFLPLAKPLVAGVTTISIVGAWWWMTRHKPTSPNSASPGPSCPGDDCHCDSSVRFESEAKIGPPDSRQVGRTFFSSQLSLKNPPGNNQS